MCTLETEDLTHIQLPPSGRFLSELNNWKFGWRDASDSEFRYSVPQNLTNTSGTNNKIQKKDSHMYNWDQHRLQQCEWSSFKFEIGRTNFNFFQLILSQLHQNTPTHCIYGFLTLFVLNVVLILCSLQKVCVRSMLISSPVEIYSFCLGFLNLRISHDEHTGDFSGSLMKHLTVRYSDWIW